MNSRYVTVFLMVFGYSFLINGMLPEQGRFFWLDDDNRDLFVDLDDSVKTNNTVIEPCSSTNGNYIYKDQNPRKLKCPDNSCVIAYLKKNALESQELREKSKQNSCFGFLYEFVFGNEQQGKIKKD